MPQKIDVPLLKTLTRRPPKTEVEIRDSEQLGFTVRALPSGGVRFYSIVGRGRREVIAHELGSGRRQSANGYPVDAADVLDRTKKEITLSWVRKEAKRLQGEAAGGVDRAAERKAKRGIPMLAQALDAADPKSYAADVMGAFNNGGTREHRDGKATLERIEKCFGHWKKLKLDEIDKPKVRAYIRQRFRKVTPATVKRELTALRALMNWHVEEEILPANPFAGVKFPKVDDDEQKIRALEPDEQKALLEAIEDRDDYLKPAVIFCLNTGLRPEELYGLEWRDISRWDSVHVRKDNSKTFTERTIPLNSAARDSVRDWWVRRGQPRAGYIFAGKGGRLTSMKKGFYAALEAAGIEKVRADGKEVRPKSLRHSFGTNSIRAGVDLKTLAKLMGHKDLRTTARYLHTDEEIMREAVDKLA